MEKIFEALESLNNIAEQRWGSNDFNLTVKQTNKRDFEIVEKALNALEIIKGKQVNIVWLGYVVDIEEYNSGLFIGKILTQEEFDLLKEVLCDERKRNR